MDQKSIELHRIKIREFLSTQSLDELSYILGRYCGPSNQILSKKKFGHVMPKDLVEQEFITRSMEQSLFNIDSQ